MAMFITTMLLTVFEIMRSRIFQLLITPGRRWSYVIDVSGYREKRAKEHKTKTCSAAMTRDAAIKVDFAISSNATMSTLSLYYIV